MISAPGLFRSDAAAALIEFSSDVVTGLSQPGQKELPSKYLWDEIGSALFDIICLLPEYGLTRAGTRLLERYSAEIVAKLPAPVVVAELGSGTGQKTRWLLEALARRQRVNYYPIDISQSALYRCQKELGQIEMVSIVGFERAYLEGLREVAARRAKEEALLVLFLGSTIGNFDRPAGARFLGQVREILREGDALLLATDLEKPVPQLLLAYDDPAGVTAAFNKNLLTRINRELGADFDVRSFAHAAAYDAARGSVDSFLEARQGAEVTIGATGARIEFVRGERIHTESSYKYADDDVRELGAAAGFRLMSTWHDRAQRFGVNLLVRE